MRPRLLLDTHILVRWLFESKKLSRTQFRTLEASVARGESIALSAITLIEIALLASGGKLTLQLSLDEFFRILISDPVFKILPVTIEIASDFALLSPLRDPSDRAITATARVHRLSLVTSDERIIRSGLVPVVE